MRAPVEPTAPPTRTTWSSKNAAPAALSSPPSSGRAPAARLVALGLSAGAIAFVGTLLVMRARAEHPMASPPAPSSPAPEVTLRLVVPHGARVLVDGVARPDGVVRGPALSSHDVRVEIEGAAPIERAVTLDGRAELAIDVPASPAPPASDPRPAVRGAGGASPVTKKSATPPVVPPPASGGLKLKVDP
jgi:hypothetical protein